MKGSSAPAAIAAGAALAWRIRLAEGCRSPHCERHPVGGQVSVTARNNASSLACACPAAPERALFGCASPGLKKSRPSGDDPSRKKERREIRGPACGWLFSCLKRGAAPPARQGATRRKRFWFPRPSLPGGPPKKPASRFEFLTHHPAHWRGPSRVACATLFTMEESSG